MSSGVPQGSHIGPILFLAFINDIKQVVKFSKFLLFADDLKIYVKINSPLDASKLQRDLNAVVDWSLDNALPFNLNKCNVISFTKLKHPFIFNYSIQNNLIPRINEIRDL